MITFPDWYEGGWPDLELVALDLLRPFVVTMTPAGQVCTALPDDTPALVAEGRAIIRATRSGLGADDLMDHAAIQIGVLTTKRSESRRVMEYLRQMLHSFERGGNVHHQDGSVTVIHSVAEIVGPQLWPELNPDHRMIVAPFQINCRKPRGLPDYARVRESL